LLTGQNIPEAAAVAEKFLAAQPDSADLQRVVAIARLRTGRAAEALAIWPGDAGETRWRVLHAALLRATASFPAAEKIAAEFDLDTLSPEEQELLAGKNLQGK